MRPDDSDGEWVDYDEAQAEIDRLQTLVDALQNLVSSVTATEFDGVHFKDVDGKNWFDSRADVLAQIP